MQKSFLRRVHNLFHGEAAGVVAILDILCNGAVEQHRLLRHDADLRSQEGHVDAVRRSAVNQLKITGERSGPGALGAIDFIIRTVTHHLALIGIVESLQELNTGALPAAAAPNKRQSLSRFHRHDQVIQHLDVWSGRVSELAIEELYFTSEILLMIDKLQKLAFK